MFRNIIISMLIAAIGFGCSPKPGKSIGEILLKNSGLPDLKGHVTVEAGYDPANPLPVKVYYYVPESADIDSRVVIVMHGASRDAERYRDNWVEYADKYGCIVVAPLFDDWRFPGAWKYMVGNAFSASGKKMKPEDTVFAAVDRIFDRLREAYGLTLEKYYLFGHSAGGQFASRMVHFTMTGKAEKIVAANAGYYTFPDAGYELPYGTMHTGYDKEHYRRAYGFDLSLMAGSEDKNPFHRSLNRSDGAMAQGKHRLERAKNYYEYTKKHAAELGVEYNWKFSIVPGVSHNNAGMAEAAADYFFGN